MRKNNWSLKKKQRNLKSLKKSNKIFLMSTLSLTIIVAGLGAYFDERRSLIILRLPETPLLEQIGIVPGKAKPSERDRHNISCDEEYQKLYFNRLDNASGLKWSFKENPSLAGIYCFVLDMNNKPTNNFPYFYFDNISYSLLNLEKVEGAGLEISNESGKLTGANIEKIYLATPEDDVYFSYYLKVSNEMKNQTRNNAKIVVQELLDNASFNNELILIDSVEIGEQNSGNRDYERDGLYTAPSYIAEGRFFNENKNRRKITLSVNPIYYEVDKLPVLNDNRVGSINLSSIKKIVNANNLNLSFENLNDRIPNSSPLKNEKIGLDVYSLIDTFNHEYGHHLSLYNREISSANQNNLIEQLKKTFGFSDAESAELDDKNKRFKDFEKLMEFFIRKGESSTYSEETDLKSFQLLRSYQNSYTTHISEIFTNGLDNSIMTGARNIGWEKEAKFLFNILATNEKISDLRKALDDIIDSNRKADETDNEFVNRVDRLLPYIGNEEKYKVVQNLLEDSFWFEKSIKKYITIPDEAKLSDLVLASKYYYLPKNYLDTNVKSTERKTSQKKVGEIFNTKEVNDENNVLDENGEALVSNWSCKDTPYFFYDTFGTQETNELKYLYRTSNKEHTTSSITQDVSQEVLSWNTYYFKKSEVMARLLNILSTDFEDNRRSLSGCNIGIEANNNEITEIKDIVDYSSQSVYSDYAFYKTFGIDILSISKEKRIELQNWLQRTLKVEKLQKNEGFFQTYVNNGAFSSLSTNSFFPFFYSYNQLSVDEQDEGSVSVYSLLNVRLDEETDRFKVRVKYGNELVLPIQYDYNNRFTVGKKVESTNGEIVGNLGKSIERIPTIQGEGAYISLAFLLHTFSSTILFPLSTISSKYSLENVTVFVDNDQNGNYNPNIDRLVRII